MKTVSATPAPRLDVRQLHAGYGRSEVLHGIDLQLEVGQSMCLVGPNGAGKSTVLNAIFGLADIHNGGIHVDGQALPAQMPAAARLGQSGIAYVLQENSIFPGLSVEQNLRLGGYLMRSEREIRDAVDRILDRRPALRTRRALQAGVLSGGERRQLEIARALMMSPRLLLIDEPSIGLEPRAVEAVFDLLRGLQADEGLSILLVEQNVRQGLGFADLGCVLVGGVVQLQGAARTLLHDEGLGRAFLGA